jgi:tRNA modification GTPase
LTERVDIGGVPFTLVDTAGLRDRAADAIEEEGISRARQAVDAADLLLLVLDHAAAFAAADRTLLQDTASRPRLIVASKSDLPAAWNAGTVGALEVSSLTDAGIDALRAALVGGAGGGVPRDPAPIANLRHAALLEQAHQAVARAAAAAAAGAPEEFVLADLHDARARFDEITGARPQDEVLRVIFERFCIGK